MVPLHPLGRIRTMSYPHVTSMEIYDNLLVCGTSLGSCLLLDAQSLGLLSSFSHLSTQLAFRCSSLFKSENQEIVLQKPSPIKFVKVSQGDVIITVDEIGLLTVLSKTAVTVQKMDLTTGRFNSDQLQQSQNN